MVTFIDKYAEEFRLKMKEFLLKDFHEKLPEKNLKKNQEKLLQQSPQELLKKCSENLLKNW